MLVEDAILWLGVRYEECEGIQNFKKCARQSGSYDDKILYICEVEVPYFTQDSHQGIVAGYSWSIDVNGKIKETLQYVFYSLMYRTKYTT